MTVGRLLQMVPFVCIEPDKLAPLENDEDGDDEHEPYSTFCCLAGVAPAARHAAAPGISAVNAPPTLAPAAARAGSNCCIS